MQATCARDFLFLAVPGRSRYTGKIMDRILTSQTPDHTGETVKVAGFVQTVRAQGSIIFLIVRDITGIVQVVVTKDNAKAMQVAKGLTLESVIEVEGLAKKAKQAPGGFEISTATIRVLSEAAAELPIPITQKGQGETDQAIRLDWRWLDLRKPEQAMVFKVWTVMEAAFREYWISKGYIEIHSPKLIGAPSESGAEVFKVQYFERTAYLAQSPQFYKQMAMAAGFEKVFEVGPVFRAEPSFTSRHATEFTGYDAELSYISSHHEVMAEEENVIQHAIQRVHNAYKKEIQSLFNRTVTVPKTPFPRLTMKETKNILSTLKVPNEKEGDLSPEEERNISEYVKEKHGHEFVFITDYPVAGRPFYHMRSEKDPALTKSFDLLWNGLEVTTGAQREHRYDILMSQAKEKRMNIESIQFYLNFFKYGCPPHGGFGMGPNRMMMQLLSLDNIRDASFMYRGVKRLEP